MNQRLDRVNKGDPIRAEAWNQIVDRLNHPVDLSFRRTRRARPGDDIRLARLQTAWRRNAAGLWTATACFVVGDVGIADTSYVFDVCAPMARSQPYGSPKSERFYVVWRGRWESLQTPAPYIPRYVSGVATAVYTNANGDYQIDNVGVQNVKIPGDSYADWGTFYLSPAQFEWGSSSLDIVGKKELKLKTKTKTVVTGIQNGVPQTETITVLDPS